jgi:hypothetical protein
MTTDKRTDKPEVPDIPDRFAAASIYKLEPKSDGGLPATKEVLERLNMKYPSAAGLHPSVYELNERTHVMDPQDGYSIEKTITELLDSLGFRATDSGYKYLISIICKCIETLAVPDKVKPLYEECAAKYGTNRKNVDVSIAKAIRNAGATGRLEAYNDLFLCKSVINGAISNALFITHLSRRFILAGIYGREVTFTTD